MRKWSYYQHCVYNFFDFTSHSFEFIECWLFGMLFLSIGESSVVWLGGVHLSAHMLTITQISFSSPYLSSRDAVSSSNNRNNLHLKYQV